MTQTDTQQERAARGAPGDAPVMATARRLRAAIAAIAAIGIDLGRAAHPVLGQSGVVALDFGPIALTDAVALTDLAEAEARRREAADSLSLAISEVAHATGGWCER